MNQKRPVAPARQALPAEAMPFKPGQVLGMVPMSTIAGSHELTDSELEILQRGGYREGDPLPDLAGTAAATRLRQHVVDVIREAEDVAGLTPIDPTTPPLAMQPTRDISQLPPSEAVKAAAAFKELTELQDRMHQAREQAKAIEELPERMTTIPGYLEAMAATQQPTAELIDDLGLSDDKPRMRKKQPVAPVAPAAPTPEAKSGSDITDLRVTCPRCQFDLNGELFTPTVEDKVSYMALVMGDQNRFRRKVSLFGGRIIVVFRSLLTSEEHLAMRQVDEDAKLDKISNLVLYASTLEDYKMVMSIESVQRKGKPPVVIAPIADYEFDDKKNRTALPEFREWLDDEVLNAGSIRRAINREYFVFTQIMHMCEVHAPDSDFFDGIE